MSPHAKHPDYGLELGLATACLTMSLLIIASNTWGDESIQCQK